MKINKVRALSIAICSFMIALCTEIQCAEDVEATIVNNSNSKSAYFEVGFNINVTEKAFIIKLVEENKIDHIRKIISGDEKRKTHISGTIIKEAISYNPGWSYHLEPTSIGFFQNAVEVSDASPIDIQEHLNDVGGSFLPNCHWTPWASKIIKEKKSL